MRPRQVIVLCWVVMFGNLLMTPAVSAAAASSPGLRWAAFPVLIVELLSFCCAFILRRRIVKAIRQLPPIGFETSSPLASVVDCKDYGSYYESLCWFVMVGNVLAMSGVLLAAVSDPDLRGIASHACIVELLSFFCAFIMRGNTRLLAPQPLTCSKKDIDSNPNG